MVGAILHTPRLAQCGGLAAIVALAAILIACGGGSGPTLTAAQYESWCADDGSRYERQANAPQGTWGYTADTFDAFLRDEINPPTEYREHYEARRALGKAIRDYARGESRSDWAWPDQARSDSDVSRRERELYRIESEQGLNCESLMS